MSANEICCSWQSGLSNETTGNVNVLPAMIDIRNGLKKCKILYDDNVNNIIMAITIF